MPRFGSTSEAEVRALADRLGLELSPGEAAGAADRLDTLAPIYADLEGAPRFEVPGRDDGDRPADRYETPPHRPDPGGDPHNAWITRFDLSRDAEGPLSGLSIAVKDNLCVRGAELTCGSLAFEGTVAGDHATVVSRLLDAGGRLAGKTNMDELAFGPTSETSAFGPTENPNAPGHVAGGSSSGSAAAVAAGEADLALGSDTGGSVRIPASYCGIVGIKPTYGLVPRYGFAALAHSMDHVGTLARDVETAARGLSVVAGAGGDGNGEDYAADLGLDPGEVTLGVADRFFERYVSTGVERRVREAIDDLESRGATVREVEIPALEHSREAWWGIAPAEFAATYATNGVGLWRRGRVEPSLAAAMARVRRGSSRDLGTNAKEMLALGARLLSTHDGYHYVRGTNLRARLAAEVDRALDEVDALVAPSTPTTAPEIGGFERGVTPPVNWNTHPTNLTGHPSISVPCGEADGLPVGLQFVGGWGAEKTVVDLAATYRS